MVATRAIIEEYARRLWREERHESMLVVVETAVLYAEEMEREDGVNRARLSKREDNLRMAIKTAAEAMEHKPATADDLEFA